MIGDLLEAEQDLRRVAEQMVQELRSALRLAAYTFAGEVFEEAIRADQLAVERWTADEWIAFFQEAAPVSQGWNDAKVLAQRLTEMTKERDALQAGVTVLRDKLALLEEQLAARSAAHQACPAAPIAGGSQEERPAKPESPAPRGGSRFRWPDVPSRPPARYARYMGKNWQRKGMALALIASGISLRVEGVNLLARRCGTSTDAGSIKRVFISLVKSGLLEKETIYVGRAKTTFVWLSDLGQKVCEACRFDLRETDYRRVLRLHGGEQQKKHAATVATFAYQARRRGFQVEVIPQVEGPAEPDAVILSGGGKPVYVEVETGRRRDRKWQNMADLQGFVAVCAGNEAAQAALVEEIKGLSIPGRATCLDLLIRDKEGTEKLWAEEWEK